MTPIIKVNNLMFSYPNGVVALRNINLEINKGEIVAIIGHNGSGKTTLVKTFNGLLKPTSGEVLINGVSTKNENTAKLSKIVGYVFQNPDDQIFNNSVYNEVAFGPGNLNLKKEEINKRVLNALEIVGLEKDKKMHTLDLSLNKKKLVTIASIIAMNPEVIILDEPSSGQDHEGTVKIEALIKELQKNHTVIIISHDMNLVSKVASRVIVMWDSNLIFDGDKRTAFMNSDLLKKTDVSPPIITQLAQKIKGFRKDILTADEFIDEIIKLKK
ncbi:putative ABC transporter ATP-binding protein [Candidatus Tiddalikarchaeum anstoanum]|nr:putative ABC transporter ATP-binding protein [Candidatus Tiddalikarchaeum anstoanum]